MSIEFLLSRQNTDGGWAYARGVSWTEPTVYATLALLLAGEKDASSRGAAWLRSRQLRDGGWPPQSGLDDSTWVTALVALLPEEVIGRDAHEAAIAWLAGASGEETSTMYRVRQWLLGNDVQPEHEFPGWPWIPGAAAWVAPTALALLALGREQQRNPRTGIAERVRQGHAFLVRRMCAGGGWNHGSVRALGYESLPYPETTGLALAALRGVSAPEVKQAIQVARGFLPDCRSADACNWLRLGLLAHNELPKDFQKPEHVVCRTTTETAVDLLIGHIQAGREVLWQAS